MPALKPTQFSATVFFLGQTPRGHDGIGSLPEDELTLTFGGIATDVHHGVTRDSCVRVRDQYPEGTEIRNTRQLSIVSLEELLEITRAMGLDRFEPGWAGANIMLRGIPDFSHVPPSSRLQAPSGATLVIDMENRPCQFPAREIEREAPGLGKGFKAAAEGRRGVTAWVERPGVIRRGDTLTLHVPDQPVWAELDAARA